MTTLKPLAGSNPEWDLTPKLQLFKKIRYLQKLVPGIAWNLPTAIQQIVFYANTAGSPPQEPGGENAVTTRSQQAEIAK
jgi:hypothetical protein